MDTVCSNPLPAITTPYEYNANELCQPFNAPFRTACMPPRKNTPFNQKVSGIINSTIICGPNLGTPVREFPEKHQTDLVTGFCVFDDPKNIYHANLVCPMPFYSTYSPSKRGNDIIPDLPADRPMKNLNSEADDFGFRCYYRSGSTHQGYWMEASTLENDPVLDKLATGESYQSTRIGVSPGSKPCSSWNNGVFVSIKEPTYNESIGQLSGVKTAGEAVCAVPKTLTLDPNKCSKVPAFLGSKDNDINDNKVFTQTFEF